MKQVFVTGANGLLGTNLIHLLLDKGFFVKALVRDVNRYKGRYGSNLQLIEGEIFDDLTGAFDGVDYVVHTAAVTAQNLLNYDEYRIVNRNATIQLFHTANKCHVKRFIFISSVNTLGHGTPDNPGSEENSIKEPFTSLLYALSKLETEECLLSFNSRMETIILNPGFILGEYDSKPSSGRIVLMGWRKRILFYPPGGKSFVYAKDVANGIIKSFTEGKNGERYILTNENLSFKEFFEKLNAIAGQNPIMVKIPRFIMFAIGYFGELLRKLRIKTSLSMVNMNILCSKNYYSNRKSVVELGLAYHPVDVAIKETLDYFRNTKS